MLQTIAHNNTEIAGPYIRSTTLITNFIKILLLHLQFYLQLPF